MLCEHCRRENEPGASSCVFCGWALPGASSGEAPKEPQATAEEVRRLKELLAQVSTRLAALEARVSMAPAHLQQAAAQPPPPPSPAIPASPAPGRAAAPRPLDAGPPPTIKHPRAWEAEWEQMLGGSWLARVGVLAIIIGVAFFLRFAFDNNWIGPTGRVVLGIVGGLAMLGLGFRLRIRYPILTQVLTGGGIAILYLSVFASMAVYHLVQIYAAIAFLVLVSAASAMLALYYDSMALAVLAIIGAFAAPFLLGAFADQGSVGRREGAALQLLAYVVVVDLGVLVLSTFRNWRWFTLLALGCSLVAFGFWHGELGRHVSLATAEAGITIIFLVFVGAISLFHIIWRRVPQAFDHVLMVVNATAYSVISIGLMWNDYRAWMGSFFLVLALFYGVLSSLALRRSPDNVKLSLFALAIALVFLTVAVPIQLGNTAWTTVVWAGEFVILVWLSMRLQMPPLRNFGFAIFAIMSAKLLFLDTSVDIRTFQPVLNGRFLAFAAGLASAYCASYLIWRHRGTISEWATPTSTLLIAASFFSVWILSFEVWDSFGSALAHAASPAREGLRSAQSLALTGVWTIYAVVGLVVGIRGRWRKVRLGALALLFISIAKVFTYDVFKLGMGYRIGAFVGLGLLLLLSAYLYQRYSEIIRGVFVEE